ncbi:2-phosphosulfolactate phosphatase [Breznakibacter xylanolyticus]|uniref:Probable 2-phosphosulfolactate phosphatase n=1 Tax=Breznakibacter xylanolyticus TaxID=990 RepID=A0A2W7NK65_9BACT|nr:2-phosphosulfolactate phosphatase [Breznakibacter xylanolyticus]PZX20668.1 2-phosphosulfolactate phosphatase [Breznakibacter xylanolyticus]
MHLDIFPSANHIEANKLDGATAVVIDVLRATSVMVTAFANGLGELITVTSPEQAFAMREQRPEVLLGGEKDAICVPGFDLDNSPFNYTRERIQGRTLVMSTSNGTRAIHGALPASRLLIGAFLNGDAVCKAISDDARVVLVCSGSQNAFTLEDALCAGFLAHRLEQLGVELQMTDFALSMKVLYELSMHHLSAVASQGNHYQLLLKKGFPRDLNYCFTPDLFQVVPRMQDGVIVC